MHHLLGIGDLDPGDLQELVSLADRIKADPRAVAGALAGRSIGFFFMKPSLRTWVSCDVAASQMGAHPIVIRNDQAGLGTRETPEDIGRVLERYLDLVGLRVFDHADLERIAAVVSVPVVNLLSDREHPCQAVADLQTLAEHRRLEGARLAYLGDGNNTCHSLVQAATMAGIEMRVATPPGYEPNAAVLTTARRHGEVLLTHDPREAVAGVDAVYTDVWASMGQEQEAAARRQLFVPYQVNLELFELAKRDAIFLHCLPAHRGEEVTDEVLGHSRSRVFDQAENRLHSFKAILMKALG
ncbi:MAG TPA: ornithine carbamoyltransferase [Acidimicrobiia bacterium]|nr:ornithine carbamoyltransferase [Acidimicrobiia bacterium]